ncbi:MAG: hypothetical protein IT209_09615 [Armatimonadetes bacterium]|nr:hypothetical protein [Armatimonadota bacterium]
MKRVGVVLAAGIAALVAVYFATRSGTEFRVDCLDTGGGQCWLVHGPHSSTAIVLCASQPFLDKGAQYVALPALRRAGVNAVDVFLALGYSRTAEQWVETLQNSVRIHDILAPDAPSSSALRWRRIRAGQSLVLNSGLRLRTVADGAASSAVIVRGRSASVALVERLTSSVAAALLKEQPGALVLSRGASQSDGRELGGYRPDIVVIHTGRTTQNRANLALVKTLDARSQRLYQTGYSGGVTICAEARRFRVYTTRAE